MKFLRIKDISKKMGVPVSTINLYRSQGKFPQCVKLSNKVNVWLEEDIEKLMQKHIDKSSEK
jgi:predicted DNA-binding transcriptional regulator AlpA